MRNLSTRSGDGVRIVMGGVGTRSRDGNIAGSSASVADGAGGGSGSGSGVFFGESVVSDGSDNDWF